MPGPVDHAMGVCQISDFVASHVPSGLQENKKGKQSHQCMDNGNFNWRFQLIK